MTSFQLTPIAENLRREELVLQIADRLQLVQALAETLFERVDAKLGAVTSRLEDIDARSSLCRRKISHLREDEGRATTLYSHHKYPKEEIGLGETLGGLLADETGYDLEEEVTRRLSLKQTTANKYETIVGTHIPYDDDAKVKSQFFIYHKVPNKRLIPEQLSDEAIPWFSITSLSSLLLFNSSLNAYTLGRQMSLTRNASNRGGHRRVGPRSTDSPTQDSPDSANPTQSAQTDDSLNFALSFKAAPELLADLPSALPSLPGISDEAFRGLFDLPNEGEEDYYGLISPSSSFGLNLPDLAHITSSTSRSSPAQTSTSALPSVPTLSSGPLLPTPPAGAPPPPPPMDIVIPSSPQSPPPPPPPSSSNLNSPTQQQQAQPKQPTISTEDGSGGRASLLDAIRKAGGVPMKKTIKERKAEEKLKKREDDETTKNEKKVAAAEPMDMMAELQKRLMSRRTGISKDSEANPNKNRNLGPPLPSLRSNKSIGAQAMDTVMAKIPVPVISEDEDDDDNDFDDDDWAD